jgi:hypothetical protein
MKYCYDIEDFINFFCVTFKNIDTKEIIYFEISEYSEDNLVSIYNFINNKDNWFIGYNNHYYDNQILNYIYTNYNDLYWNTNLEICKKLFELNVRIIKEDFNELKYNLPFNSVDLMKIGGLYQKSLKMSAINLEWPLIQDLPYKWDSIIQQNQIDIIRKYNLNDVEITEKLYNFLLPEIKLRKEITKLYNVNVMEEPDSGMANRLLEKFYSQSTGLKIQDFKNTRTSRTFIPFKKVIFDNIKFETDDLKKFLSDLKEYNIYYKEDVAINPFKKNIIFKNLKLNLGVGGIHSDDQPALFKEDENYYIIDCDIGSMYPTTIINHKLCPEHLSNKFVTKYKEVRDLRLQAKKNKETAKAEGLKTVLNSTFGKTGMNKHWLYDPLVMYQITVNNQLYILTLIEQLILNDFEVISTNTDGITCKVLKKREEDYYKVCKEWSINNNFELEYKKYKIYARRDVNNYIALQEDNIIKEKGDFITSNLTKTNNVKLKGVDKKIIAIALKEFFINNIPIRNTILNHRNIYDFCIAQKIDDKFINEYHYIKDNTLIKEILQKTIRYYISKNGGTLYKVDKKINKYIAYCVGRKETIFNTYIKYDDFNNYNIDYGYYISETQKIIDLIINPQLSLF